VNRFGRLLLKAACVTVALMFIACANETTAPEPEFARSTQIDGPAVSLPLGFTKCIPQPFASDTARIGPSGGTLRAGRHMLKIPAGALKRSVLITMAAPSDSLNYVVFGPEGLTFDPANLPTLSMSYRNCSLTKPAEESLEIVYTDDSLTTVLDTTETVASDTLNHVLGATLKHFSKYVLQSRYAVAY
jgi:hypothetical protein